MPVHLPLQLAVRVVRGDLAAAVGKDGVHAGAAYMPPGAHHGERRRGGHLQRRQQLSPKRSLREVCRSHSSVLACCAGIVQLQTKAEVML